MAEDPDWIDGYDTGHRHASEGKPNMVDVLGRPCFEKSADVIQLLEWLPNRGAAVSAEPWDCMKDEVWVDGYDTGYEDGAGGMPNVLDVLGRPPENVIDLREWKIARGVTV